MSFSLDVWYNKSSPKSPAILDILPEFFTLTGSRFFGVYESEDTDYDFLTYEGDPKMEEFRDNFTFIEKDFREGYEGAGTVAVLYPTDGSKKFNVIVKENKETYDRYIELFHSLEPDVFYKYFWKSSPKYPKTQAAIKRNLEKLLTLEVWPEASQ